MFNIFFYDYVKGESSVSPFSFLPHNLNRSKNSTRRVKLRLWAEAASHMVLNVTLVREDAQD